MTLKKSELRTIIREILKEEMQGLSGISYGSAEDIAFRLFHEKDFAEAFRRDGNTLGYEVENFVLDHLVTKCSRLQPNIREQLFHKIMKHLRYFAREMDTESVYHDRTLEVDLDRIYNDHFDKNGNMY